MPLEGENELTACDTGGPSGGSSQSLSDSTVGLRTAKVIELFHCERSKKTRIEVSRRSGLALERDLYGPQQWDRVRCDCRPR
jgi:hypothetical protein